MQNLFGYVQKNSVLLIWILTFLFLSSGCSSGCQQVEPEVAGVPGETIPTISPKVPPALLGKIVTPTFSVAGLSPDDQVNIYTEATCSNQIQGSATSTGNSVDVTITNPLPEGSHVLYAQIVSSKGTVSSCLNSGVTYTVDTTSPTITNVTTTTNNGSYGQGKVINIEVTFSEHVILSGADANNPYLELNTMPTLRSAVYSTGSGTSTLTFTYTVASGDNATVLDYTSTTAFAMNAGAALQDSAGNSADLALAVPGLAGSLSANKLLTIDTSAPAAPSSLSLKDPLASPGIVSTPTLTVNGVLSGDVVKIYDSPTCANSNLRGSAIASGTSVDVTVSAQLAAGAYTFYANSTDPAGNISNCSAASTNYTFSPPPAPVITSVTSSSANGAYKSGTINVQVIFNNNVTVVGTPLLNLNTNPARNATYSSGSGTNTLNFIYSITAGDTSADLDYASTNSLTLNSGSIKDSIGTAATLTLAAPGAAGSLGNNKDIQIDAQAPNSPSSLTLSNPATSPGTSSTPTITVSGVANGDVVQLFTSATCSGGSNESATSTGASVNITVSPLTEGSYTFYARSTDAVGNSSTCSTSNLVYAYDNTAPVVTNVSSNTANGSYGAGTVNVQISFSEAVNVTGIPILALNTTPGRRASYTSGSGSNTLNFTYTIVAGDSASKLDYNSTTALALGTGTIKDTAGINATLTLATPGTAGSLGANKNIVIDTTAPAQLSGLSLVTPASSPGNIATPTIAVSGTTNGDTIKLFSDNLCTVVVGSAVSAGATTNVTVNPALPPGSYTFYANSTDSSNNVSPCSAASVSYVYDSTLPTVTNITSSIANGTYVSGNSIDVQIQFSEVVNVNVSGGAPTLSLNTSPTQRTATYVSGSGTNTLTFTYTVQSNDNSGDLDYTSTSALVLAGGTIKDLANNNATLTLVSPGTAGSLGGNKNIAIDNTAPSAPSGLTLNTPTLSPGNIASPVVTVSGVVNGDTVKLFTDSSCTIEKGSAVAAATSMNVTSGALTEGSYNFYATSTDPAGNVSACSNTSLAYNFDATAPTVAQVTSSNANGTYSAGSISIQLAFSETVNVTGTPLLALNTNPARNATYSSGSGSNTLTFIYTISTNDNSVDLDFASTGALSLNGGTIKDVAGNAATLTLVNPGDPGSLGANKNIVINATVPSTPSGLSLKSPATSPNNVATPSITVTGVTSGDTVKLFSDVSCTVLMGSAVATANSIDITTDALASGSTYTFYANTTSSGGVTSLCSANNVTYIYDGAAPTITNVTSATANGSYTVGSVISIQVEFSEAVTVTGSPALELNTTPLRSAGFFNGSGSTILNFSYTVQATDTASDLDYSSTAALALNGGTIKDAAGNNATLTLVTPGSGGSLGSNKNIVIDTTATGAFTITGVTGNGDTNIDTHLTGAGLPTVNWNASANHDSYDVTIYDNDGTTVRCPTVNSSAASTNFAFISCGGNFTQLASYKALVVAKDSAGNTTSATGGLFSFKYNSEASTSLSTITGTSPVAADGTSISTITITLRNSDNIAIEGIVPTFAATDTGSTNLYGACSSSSSSGISTCTLKSTIAETKALSVTAPISFTGGNVVFQSVSSPTKLTFLASSPSTATVDTCTGAFTVQTQDAGNNAVNVAANTTVNITENGAGAGVFYSDNNCTTGNEITSFVISSGQNQGSFYFTNDTAETLNVQASATGLTDATRAVTVSAPAGPPDTWTSPIGLAFNGRSKHSAIWTGTEMIIWGGVNGINLDTGMRYNPSTDSWTNITTIGAPVARREHASVWTGTEMIIWGGTSGVNYNTGGKYNPSTDSWVATQTTGAPAAKTSITAIWTGTEMIVWGGWQNTVDSTGGRYNPTTDSWVATQTTGAPTARWGHSIIWTGTEMIVWAGNDGSAYVKTGGRYNPSTNTWVATKATGGGMPAVRAFHSAVWTGTDMIIFGGTDGTTSLNSGGKYTPSSDTWVATSTTGAPSIRYSHSAVWTGTEMIIWGGFDGTNYFNTGAKYNPSANTWVATQTVGAPTARYLNTALWSGSEMIVWGGSDATNTFNSGGKYNPSTDSWLTTRTYNSPLARAFHTAVWTGTEMIVWGGNKGTTYLNTGGKYNPSTDSWVATQTSGAPAGRRYHTAVWTGTEMIIWGGMDSASTYVATGGKYNPSTDSWVATQTTDAPTARRYHTATWTGTEMIVWGGNNVGTYYNTGGKYDPASDSWLPTQTTNAPEARFKHIQVWTGEEIIVWGGNNPAGPATYNTGGKYNPATDSWTATQLTNAPTARLSHAAVWTGTEMIIWGGSFSTTYYNDGAKYNPATDSWVAIQTANAPTGRSAYSTIWTGTEMIIWGGISGTTYYNDGAKYNPSTDSWSATQPTGAPIGRNNHTAVWTGTNMIIWGGNSFSTTLFLEGGGIYNP